MIQNNNSFQNENYQRFRKFFDQMNAGLLIYTPDVFFVEVKESFCTITGYSKRELGKTTFQYLIFPDNLNHEPENIKQIIKRKTDNYIIEKRYIKKDKSVRWVKLYLSAIIENELSTNGIKNYRDSKLYWGVSPLQLSYNPTGTCLSVGYYSYIKPYVWL